MDLSKTPELVNLPWEYLYEPSQKRFLALSEDTPVVRYLELPDRIKPVPVKPPVRVLVVIASPKDKAPLDSAREFQKLKGALETLVQNGMVEVDLLEKPTFKVLLKGLKRKPYHIFHFVGHGQFDDDCHEGLLLFEDEEGNGDPVSAQALGVLLRDEPSLRLAVLNACEGARVSSCDLFGGTAQTLIQQGIPAVIAMQAEISDESAQNFAETFYSALATGSAVDAALADVRKVIYGEGSVEWGTPVLYMRSADGRVFDVDRMSVEVRRRDRIAELSRQAEEAVTAVHWPTAVQKLKDLVALDPSNQKAVERLRFVEQLSAKPAPGSALTVPVPAVDVARPAPEPAPAGPVPETAPAERAGAEPLETPAAASAWRGPAILLAVVFFANLVETSTETWLQRAYDLGVGSSHRIAYAVHSLEGRVSFENHDLADPIAIYGYSIAYFFLFPLLAFAVAVALARRKDPPRLPALRRGRRHRLPDQPAVFSLLPRPGALGVSRLGRDAAFGSLVQPVDRGHTADQRIGQLLSELSRVSHGHPDRVLLSLPVPVPGDRPGPRYRGHPFDVRPRDPLDCRHPGGRFRGRAQRFAGSDRGPSKAPGPRLADAPRPAPRANLRNGESAAVRLRPAPQRLTGDQRPSATIRPAILSARAPMVRDGLTPSASGMIAPSAT